MLPTPLQESQTSAASFQHRHKIRLIILLRLFQTGTLLTSPTIYVSYDKLYASNSCSGVGKTYSHTIVPIAAASDLSSMSMYIGYMHDTYFTTVPFDLNDLVEPIPESIYEKQPRCQASRYGWELGGMAAQGGNFSCASLGPYAPVIAVPTGVQNLDPEWKSCTAFYGGLFDPPKALEQAQTADGITAPVAVPGPTTAASPGSAVTDPGPTNTNSPVGSTTIAAEPTRALSNSVKEPPQDEATLKPADPTRPGAEVSRQHSEGLTDESNALTLLAPVQSDAPCLEAVSGNTAADPLISAIALLAAASQAIPSLINADAAQNPQAHQPAAETLAQSDRSFDNPRTESIASPGITLTDSKGQPTVIAPVFDSDAVLISAEGFATTIRAGQFVTVGGQLVGITQVDPSVAISDGKTFPMSRGTGNVAETTITGDIGRPIEIKSEDRHIVINAGTFSVGLDPGQATSMDGVSISAPESGAYVVLNGDKTVSLAAPATRTSDISFVTGISGQKIAFSGYGGHLVIADHGNTATLNPGEITTFDGRVVSVEPQGSYAVVDGMSTIKLGSQPTVPGMAATTSGTAGQSLTLSKNEDGDLIVADGNSTITLGAAEATTIDGLAISVDSSGFVLDGTKTVGLETASRDTSDYTSTASSLASTKGVEVGEVASRASSTWRSVAGNWSWTVLMLVASLLLS